MPYYMRLLWLLYAIIMVTICNYYGYYMRLLWLLDLQGGTVFAKRSLNFEEPNVF